MLIGKLETCCEWMSFRVWKPQSQKVQSDNISAMFLFVLARQGLRVVRVSLSLYIHWRCGSMRKGPVQSFVERVALPVGCQPVRLYQTSCWSVWYHLDDEKLILRYSQVSPLTLTEWPGMFLRLKAGTSELTAVVSPLSQPESSRSGKRHVWKGETAGN